MYCTNCGAQNPEGSKFCSNCGTRLVSPQPSCSDHYRREDTFNRDLDSGNSHRQNPECYRMGWHKFLIYFLLIGQALFFLFTAYIYISGAGFGEEKDYIFSNFPDVVQTVKLNGYFYLALGIFTLVTRNSLAKLKAGAPEMLILVYVFTAVLAVIGNLMIAPALGTNAALTSLAYPIISSIFWICINRSYYKKRKDLFVNY